MGMRRAVGADLAPALADCPQRVPSHRDEIAFEPARTRCQLRNQEWCPCGRELGADEDGRGDAVLLEQRHDREHVQVGVVKRDVEELAVIVALHADTGRNPRDRRA